MKLFLLSILFTTLVFSKLFNESKLIEKEKRRLIGSVSNEWDGKIIRNVNEINVVSTVKSLEKDPDALNTAVFTIEYMMNKLRSQKVKNALKDHNVYIFHCDPALLTGSGEGLNDKDEQYDYLTDLLNMNQPIFDGRSYDQTYGSGGGGVWSGDNVYPTTTCDCDLLVNCLREMHDSTLIHEFGHTIMDIGLKYGDHQLYDDLDLAFYEYEEYLEDLSDQEYSGKLYVYCGQNKQEMWACGVQVWLIGTKYEENWSDDNSGRNIGIVTLNDIKENASKLYDVLMNVFGESPYKQIEQLKNLGDIKAMSSNEQLYYGHNIPLYGNNDLKIPWYMAVEPTLSPTPSPIIINN